MANKGNFIDAESLIKKLNTAFNEHKIAIEESAKALNSLEGAYSKLPSDYIKAQKQVLDLQSKQVTVEGKLIDLSAKKERLAQTEIRTQKLVATEKEKSNKATEKELALLAKANSLYNQTQQKVNELTKTYNDLAIKKALGEKLTATEVIQLHKLITELNMYQSALKKVDADIQKNQRNVGNYASGWNGLGNSINQLSREMPAFANSAQTGFMALSNNLPILFDEITKIKNANKELIAQGQPVKSLFSQIAGSVLSWGTALSIGVTLLTVFGPKLWDMVSSSKATKKALEEEKKVREEKASIEKQAYEQQVRYASDEQAKAKIMLENAKNLNLPLAERVKYVDELQSRYPAYLGSLSKEQILAGDTADAEYRLNDALMKRAMFLAVQDKIVETTKQLVDAEMQYAKTNKEATKTDELYDLAVQKKTASKQKYRLVNEQDLATTKGLEFATKKSDQAIVNSTTVYNEKTLATRKQLDILYSILNQYAKYNNVVVEDTKNTKANTKAKEEAIKVFTEDWFQKQISNYETLRGKVADTTKEYASYTNQINVLKMLLDQLQGKETPDLLRKEQLDALDEGIKKMTNYEEVVKDVAKETEALKKATDDFIDSFNKSFLGEAGLPAMDMFLRLEENGKTVFQNLLDGADTLQEKFQVTFLAISQVAEEAFAFISQSQQANYDAQYSRLEQQRDIAIRFAGESATAQEEINNQYDARRRAIQRKQAQDEKKTAIFKAVINTAQAVVSALPNIPLSIAVGLIGAAQIALIQSQQIPQFWKGTDNAPEGVAWTQEKGREIITDRSGKIKSLGSDKGAQLTQLSRGDKVFTAGETEAFMFNNNLNNLLLGNGINMPKVDISMDTSILGGKIDNLAKTIAEKPSFTLVKDAKGERVYQRKQAEVKEMLNARLNIRGYDV